ncbi:MAG: hypothetical protein QNK36_14815 [Colwellia sp.]|nr:hypothetical protein [Colwellia sp.]
MATQSKENQLNNTQLAKIAKSLENLTNKAKKQSPSKAFETLGVGLSAMGSKFAAEDQKLKTDVTDDLGEHLYNLAQALSEKNRQNTCADTHEPTILADTLVTAGMGVLALGDSIKPPPSLLQDGKDNAKIMGSIQAFRECASALAEYMILIAAEQYQAENNEIASIHIPELGPIDDCGCHQSPVKLAPAPITLSPIMTDYAFPEVIGASQEELLEILRLFLELLMLLAILLSVMPAVGCTNNCTEGALRATMSAHGSDAQGNSTFDIQWDYCCIEACFLWVTGTYWHSEGTTSHTAGNPLGTNRRVPATRRAKIVGNASANWVTNGGVIPAIMRRHRVRPAMVAPTSSC